MPVCVFCSAPPAGSLYADRRCFVMLHEDRAVRGHAMVVWREHVENLSSLSSEDLAHFMRVHAAAERVLLHECGVERAVLMKLGIQTPHLHLHIYPVSATLERRQVMSIIEGESCVAVEAELALRVQGALRLALA